MSAREQIFIASELRANRARDLQGRAEANLPEIVRTIHKDKKLRQSAEAPFVLDQIRDFYKLNSLPIPNEISKMLSELPRSR